MIDYTTLTPEQAAKAARAETLKELIAFCEKEMKEWHRSPEANAVEVIKYYCQEKLNAIQ